ncbi:hypothetical protein L228DRAFT_49175 [Xylona heveae TC161]|uniref:Uncharacterized protein n=1 Tax=Xylona heveae (strain CBS 132557 / TC161) TaxID=1328760 RepID=A0A164ZL65_XYLHT|nr:hypothetical protein L228DRAFT_49175 [Xylona heveae TC161]KZF19233.1 hypothetical protein L228DRAFT_49175 [Xylona heveae TC161]
MLQDCLACWAKPTTVDSDRANAPFRSRPPALFYIFFNNFLFSFLDLLFLLDCWWGKCEEKSRVQWARNSRGSNLPFPQPDTVHMIRRYQVMYEEHKQCSKANS